ncbi:MAG: hydroxyacid dehydrogenase [Pseudomonadota bacterium]
MTLPLVLIDPAPRSRAMILTDEAWAELNRIARVVAYWDSGRMPAEQVEEHLEEAAIIIGQPPLPKERLDRARQLQAVINVRGNWEPSIDYEACQARGIRVLSIAPAMAPAVAEMSLGMAIDLARGITLADRDFRAGRDRYGIAGNEQAYGLFGARVGLIGYGNLGRSLRPLLAPFGCDVAVYDPWLPAGYLAEQGCKEATLDDVLACSAFLFILAGVTSENEGFLDRQQLAKIAADACVVLASRAEVVDFNAFVELAEARRFRAAIDVFPEEPVPPDHPVRQTNNILLSSHRAGGIWASYRRISEMMMEDIRQILAGHPPVRLQAAEPRQAAIMRSR